MRVATGASASCFLSVLGAKAIQQAFVGFPAVQDSISVWLQLDIKEVFKNMPVIYTTGGALVAALLRGLRAIQTH